MPSTIRNTSGQAGFQGSETSSAEFTVYTSNEDPIVFVGREGRDRKITTAGRKAQDVDPSLISLSTNKTMGAASGSWTATLKPSKTAEKLFDQIIDDDWVDIVFTRHARRWHVMRGLVDDMRETTAVSGEGVTTSVFEITGRDFGKIWEVTPIWFSVFTDEKITGGVSLKVFGGQPNIQGSPSKSVRGFLFGFMEELAGVGRAVWKPPSTVPNIIDGNFIDSVFFDDKGFTNIPARTGINPNYMMPNGTAWSLAQEWSDPGFSELYVDTLPDKLNPQGEGNPFGEVLIEDTEMRVVFRDRPFPTEEDVGTSTGPWFQLPLHIIPRQAIINSDLGRSGHDRYNSFMIAPQLVQEVYGSLAIDGAAPLWNKDDILRHGMRRFDIMSRYTAPKADLVSLTETQRKRIRDWYALNAYFLNGSINLGLGQPNIHIGERVRIPGVFGDSGDQTFYVEAVNHNWSFGPGIRTSLGVTRGWRGTEETYAEGLIKIIGKYELAIRTSPGQSSGT